MPDPAHRTDTDARGETALDGLAGRIGDNGKEPTARGFNGYAARRKSALCSGARPQPWITLACQSVHVTKMSQVQMQVR